MVKDLNNEKLLQEIFDRLQHPDVDDIDTFYEKMKAQYGSVLQKLAK